MSTEHPGKERELLLEAAYRQFSEVYRPDCDDTERITAEILHGFGIDEHLGGYWYLRSAIRLATERPQVLRMVTRDLYPAIAQIFQTTPDCVIRCISNAIATRWESGDVTLKNNFFGFTPRGKSGCPSNTVFIASIADTIRLYQKEQAKQKPKRKRA